MREIMHIPVFDSTFLYIAGIKICNEQYHNELKTMTMINY